MAISQSNDNEVSEDLALGPGKRLREARLARNLEVEDVAIRLRLHVKTINSIEADDYAHLPAPTFIRGYLRGYARLLALPCEPIIESYERHGFAPPPLVRDISKRDEIKSTDFPVRVITYAIVGILIIFVTIWWQNQQVQPLSLDVGNLDLGATLSDDSEAGIDTIPIAIVDNSSEQTSPGDNGQATGTESASGAPTSSDGIEPEPVSSALDSDSGSPGVTRLQISFKHESWVEIYGGGEKMLYYNLAKPGEIIDLRDSGPLRVLLGYVDGVNVKVNGKPFDVKAHTTAGIAKFTLDAPNSNEELQPLPQSDQQQ